MPLGSLLSTTLKVFSSSVKLFSTAQKLVKSWWIPICMWKHLKSFHSLVLGLATSCFIPPADWWQWKSRIQIRFKSADSLTAVSCIAQLMVFFCRSRISFHLRFFHLLYLILFCYFSNWTKKENSFANLESSLVTSSRMASLKSLSQRCNAVIYMDWKENKLSPELLPKPSPAPSSSPGKLHSSGCENGCKNTTCRFQSARTGADHQKVNTALSQFRNTVFVEPTLQIWLQAPLGDHTREQELVGKGPLHRNSHSGLTCVSQLAWIIPDLLHLSSGYQDGEFMVPHGCSQGLLKVCTAAFL